MPKIKNPDLKLVAIRLLQSDIQVARREAAVLAIPYQHVVRAWVNEAARRATKRRALSAKK